MILSKAFRFIFVKGKKVGGTSIECAMAELCGEDDIVAPIAPIDDVIRIKGGHPPRNFAWNKQEETDYIQRILDAAPRNFHAFRTRRGRYFNHMPLADIEDAYGDISGFTVICAERSPYEKLLSAEKWSLARTPYQRADGTSGLDLATLRASVTERFSNGTLLSVRNIDRYRDKNGRLPQIVLRHETLDADFAAAMRSLGVNDPPPLPRMKQSPECEVAIEDVFTRAQLDMVNREFAEEFLTFGFHML